jgi:hypothetical protein
MSIKDAIRKELATGPKSLRLIATLTGHDLESIRNAKGYLQSDGIVKQVAGQKPGAPDILFELVPVLRTTNHGNVLKSRLDYLHDSIRHRQEEGK